MPRRIVRIRPASIDDAEITVIYNEGTAECSAALTLRCVDLRISESAFYISGSARGHCVGSRLLLSLTDAARTCGFWKLVSHVFTFNHASRTVYHKMGFREVGIYEKHSCLDGRWLDVVIVERLIPEKLDIAPVATK